MTMHSLLKIIVAAIVGTGLVYGIVTMLPLSAVNPDPNHIHADFAVWVNGEKLDFSGSQYMSAPLAEEASLFLIPQAVAHGDEDDGHTVPGREYLHLHDGNGSVIHRHKPGLTLGDFFTSIGLQMTKECLTLDAYQFGQLDPDWIKDFARTKRLCNDGKFHWTFVVNGEERPMDPGFIFNDGDQILLSYGAGDMWSAQWSQMTSDACMFSKTCPWKGEPPSESCVADPAVPCVEG